MPLSPLNIAKKVVSIWGEHGAIWQGFDRFCAPPNQSNVSYAAYAGAHATAALQPRAIPSGCLGSRGVLQRIIGLNALGLQEI